MQPPFRVLFVCADNAILSQMAEGFLRAHGGNRFLARSAGIRSRHLHPLATRVMQEADVDIAGQRGVGTAAFKHERFDLLVTLSDDAKAECPRIAGVVRVEHTHFDDPAWLEDPDGGADMDEYRRVRDEIRAFVSVLIERTGR